jgi:hypothetical protein
VDNWVSGGKWAAKLGVGMNQEKACSLVPDPPSHACTLVQGYNWLNVAAQKQQNH